MQVCRGSFGDAGRISGDAWVIGLRGPGRLYSSRVAYLKKREAAGIMLRQRIERYYP
jgi:hypothetical protein